LKNDEVYYKLNFKLPNTVNKKMRYEFKVYLSIECVEISIYHKLGNFSNK